MRLPSLYGRADSAEGRTVIEFSRTFWMLVCVVG
jgi:hypothetical protein